MVKELNFIIANGTNPYENIALEEYLTDNVKPGQCMLYLWQNKNTVVIGKNQNAYKECKIDALKAHGGLLARRLSGGGAVYHDMGNLNFTFITTAGDYDVDRHLSVIGKAVGSYGINVEKTGRNDICADGRKFSGNAFLKRGERMYHHGTILIDADMAALSKYLNASYKKLESKGVESVKSRVVNLKELNPAVTVEGMKERLLAAFEEVYNTPLKELSPKELDMVKLEEMKNKFASEKWLYGQSMTADIEFGERFSWGEISINFALKGNVITGVKIYTDAMDEELSGRLEGIFLNREFSPKALKERLLEEYPCRESADIGELLTRAGV